MYIDFTISILSINDQQVSFMSFKEVCWQRMFLFQPRASIHQDTSLWKQLAFCRCFHFCYYNDSCGPPDSWGYVKKSYYQDSWIPSCPGNLQSHVNRYYTVFHFNICTQAKGVLCACFRAHFIFFTFGCIIISY